MALPQRRTLPTEHDWHTLYQIEHPADIDAFVAAHPEVVPVLTAAFGEIRSRFGPSVTLVLDRMVDRDDEPASDYLALGIRFDAPDDESFARRRQLDDEWWLDAIREVPGLLTIDLALP